METVGRSRVRNRKIKSVAGTYTDGSECSAHRAERRRDHAATPIIAKQSIPEAATLPREGGRSVLRAATVVAECDQQPLALRGAFCGAAIEFFQIVSHSFKRVALLIDLPTKATALRRRIAEDREKSRAFATNASRLRHKPVDLELLTVDRILDATNLLNACGVRIATIDRRKLGLKPLTGRIGRLRVGSGDSRQRNSGGKCRLPR